MGIYLFGLKNTKPNFTLHSRNKQFPVAYWPEFPHAITYDSVSYLMYLMLYHGKFIDKDLF